MSEHASPTAAADEPATLQTGLEAFQSSAEFNGPVEHLDGHQCNDHFAQIYETDAERFAAATPFVRHGLDRDECVMYVLDESSTAEVRAVLRDGGVDVDAALDAGQLSFHTVQDTYLRNGSFDPDEMVDFYADTVAEATDEYEALRIVAETTWLEDDATTVEQFMEYESKINRLFADEDCLALCQYDRNGFPPEVVRNIVQTHPHLVYDGTACHNFYYTPPAEFFGPDRPEDEVDRMLGTLRDRTEAKATLQRHDRFLQDLYHITADPNRSFEEKIHALLDLGRDQFGLDVGGLNRVDPDANYFEVEYLSGDHDVFEPGAELPLSDTYCRAAADIEAAATVVAPTAEGFDDIPVFEEYGIEGYIGTYIPVDGGTDRTLGFVPAESEPVSFSEEDRTYLELMGQWVGYELNRRQRERFLRECYEVTSDPSKSYEEKLHGLFDLGCEQFGFDVGGLSTVDPETDLFEVEAVNGDHDHFEPGVRADLSETYCRLVTEDGDTTAVTDPVGAGFEGNRCYEEFGVRSYLGTRLEIDGDANRTFWFVSAEPRDGPVTDEERTFVHLMGQWVKYELEQQQRERELRERKEYLSALVETAPECIKTVAADGTLLQMNAAGLGMVEADAASAVTGECVYDLIAPEDREQFREFNERICSGEHGTLEFDIVGLEGTRRHMETHAAPLDRPDGTTVQVALTRDVTEQKERKRELQRTERRFEAIFEDPNILVGLLDPDGTVLDINQTAMEYIDADLDAVTGEPFWETPWWGESDEISSDVRRWVERAANGEYVDFEADLTRPDGQRYTLEGVFRPVTNDDGDVVSVIISDRDITERKRRERALEESERRYRTLVENFPNGAVALADHEMRYVTFGGTPEGDTDMTSDDLEGESLREGLPKELAEVVVPGYEAALDGDRSTFEATVDDRIYQFQFLPVRDDDGDVFAALGMSQDITEREAYRRQLEESNDRLESFASMLAHELRNPVQIGQIYSRQLPAGANSEAVGYVTEAFDRIEDMIDVMLVLTRGRDAVGERTPIELAEVARGAWADVDAPDASLDVTTDRTIRADETYIRHLFRNLLANAVEHGGADVTVTVGALPDGFYVADDGTGIPPEDRDAIFDEGYTTAADAGGSGLGLAFVRKLAAVYEWDYAVTESEDGGARFEFRNVAQDRGR